jgi:hypothetical protein
VIGDARSNGVQSIWETSSPTKASKTIPTTSDQRIAFTRGFVLIAVVKGTGGISLDEVKLRCRVMAASWLLKTTFSGCHCSYPSAFLNGFSPALLHCVTDAPVEVEKTTCWRNVMPPRKHPEHLKLESSTTKIGEPVPKAVIDINTESVGVPPQPHYDPAAELGALREQVDILRRHLSGTASVAKGGARQAARHAEATVKLYPVSTLVTVAAVAAGFALPSPVCVRLRHGPGTTVGST